jgi:hypothetical protein
MAAAIRAAFRPCGGGEGGGRLPGAAAAVTAGEEPAASLVARALSRRQPGERARFLRELLAHTAAGLVIVEGERAAGEAVYRLADAVVARGGGR